METNVIPNPRIVYCNSLAPRTKISLLLPGEMNPCSFRIEKLEVCAKEYGLLASGQLDSRKKAELRIKRNGEISLCIFG